MKSLQKFQNCNITCETAFLTDFTYLTMGEQFILKNLHHSSFKVCNLLSHSWNSKILMKRTVREGGDARPPNNVGGSYSEIRERSQRLVD